MTLYAVIHDSRDKPLGRKLSMRDAAALILSDDSQEWEIREDVYQGEPRFDLWTRKQCANKPWSKTVLMSFDASRAVAENEIFELVVMESFRWLNSPYALTEEQYERQCIEAGIQPDERAADLIAEVAALKERFGDDVLEEYARLRESHLRQELGTSTFKL